ncbi:MAG: hypothetical protein NTZ89_06285 [Actinobacteria bacterium]|nr:hypothetical protein [Actinomycetota bacterium]
MSATYTLVFIVWIISPNVQIIVEIIKNISLVTRYMTPNPIA